MGEQPGPKPLDVALAGRTALVTGAAGGIGRAVVLALESAGAAVTATDLPGEGLQSLAGERGAPPARRVSTLDVADPVAIASAVRGFLEERGHIDILVNAAGISTREPALEATVEDWERVQSVNLRGTFLTCQQAARAMVAAGRGSIVNVASELAMVGDANHAAYISSKSGVVGLTRALAVEWGPMGVRVNAVAPGLTATAMTADLAPAVREEYRTMTPNRRIGLPEDIAGPVLFLASDLSRHVTGQVLVVDGGFTIA
jgi:D-threitol dehydrogenase (NAD+)